MKNEMRTRRLVHFGIVGGAIVGITVLHYSTAMSHVWLHPLLENSYYVPVLLGAMWFGWRGGLLAAAFAGFLYVPFIRSTWNPTSTYSASQYIEIGMFFLIGGMSGALFDLERKQRTKVEHTAQQLSEVYSQLQASFEQLRRADRLSALGELSAGLAHEIRNPLGSIEGAVQILQRPNLTDDTKQEFGKMAEEEIGRLKGLLTHFLQFARPPAPRRSPTNLGELLDAVRRLADETAKMTGCSVMVKLAEELPAVSVDPEQIKQALLDLVLNAIQATPGGGEVLLRAVRECDSVVLEVQDKGTGIEEENLQKVFDPFFTTRSGGTGLGLPIAHQIVAQHGGHIELRRNPERGMTFSVVLPLQPKETPEQNSSLVHEP
ncbi:MAG: two-component system sensor histidine kinase NtrB [Candidatus Acidiferrales bacterium]